MRKTEQEEKKICRLKVIQAQLKQRLQTVLLSVRRPKFESFLLSRTKKLIAPPGIGNYGSWPKFNCFVPFYLDLFCFNVSKALWESFNYKKSSR